MNPDSIRSFRFRAAVTHNMAHGVNVYFREAIIKVILSPIKVDLGLAEGGIMATGEYTCRFLASTLHTPPVKGEQMNFNGRKYTVSQIEDTISTPGEYVVTIKPGSKL